MGSSRNAHRALTHSHPNLGSGAGWEWSHWTGRVTLAGMFAQWQLSALPAWWDGVSLWSAAACNPGQPPEAVGTAGLC